LRLDRTRGIDPGFAIERIKDEDLKRLELLPQLREITFENRHDISDQGLLHLISLRHLRKLNLSRTRVSGATFGSMAHLPLLHEIKLNSCANVGDETAKSLTHFKKLTKLQLDGSSNSWMSESSSASRRIPISISRPPDSKSRINLLFKMSIYLI